VTAEVEASAEAAQTTAAERKVKAQEEAVEKLAIEVDRRADAREPPLNLTGAVEMLHAGGVLRDAARKLLDRETGTRWRLVKDDAQHGHPKLVVGVNQEWPPEKDLPLAKPHQSGVSDDSTSSGGNVHRPEAGSPTENPCQSRKSDGDAASGPETIPPEKKGDAEILEPQRFPEDSSFSGGCSSLPPRVGAPTASDGGVPTPSTPSPAGPDGKDSVTVAMEIFEGGRIVTEEAEPGPAPDRAKAVRSEASGAPTAAAAPGGAQAPVSQPAVIDQALTRQQLVDQLWMALKALRWQALRGIGSYPLGGSRDVWEDFVRNAERPRLERALHAATCALADPNGHPKRESNG
jgi:hypothetical protein